VRVIAFLNEIAMDEILSKGVYKMYGAYLVQCLYSINGKPLCFRSIGEEWESLDVWGDGTNPDIHMIELEIEEKDVVNKYQESCIVEIKEINKKQVVCYRTCECKTGFESAIVITNVINDELCPLWRKPVVFNKDGYPRDYDKYMEWVEQATEDENEKNEAYNTTMSDYSYMLESKCLSNVRIDLAYTQLLNRESRTNFVKWMFGREMSNQEFHETAYKLGNPTIEELVSKYKK